MRRKVYPARADQVPADAVWQRHEDLGVEIATYTSANGMPSARGWSKKTDKPDFAHFYRDVPHRDAMVLAFVNKIKDKMEAKARQKAERKAEVEAGLDIAVGDIFYESGRIVHFHQVVALVGKQSVSIRPINKRVTAESDEYGRAMPAVDEFMGEAVTKRINRWNNIANIRYGRAAYKWDGVAKQEIYFD